MKISIKKIITGLFLSITMLGAQGGVASTVISTGAYLVGCTLNQIAVSSVLSGITNAAYRILSPRESSAKILQERYVYITLNSAELDFGYGLPSISIEKELLGKTYKFDKNVIQLAALIIKKFAQIRDETKIENLYKFFQLVLPQMINNATQNDSQKAEKLAGQLTYLLEFLDVVYAYNKLIPGEEGKATGDTRVRQAIKNLIFRSAIRLKPEQVPQVLPLLTTPSELNIKKFDGAGLIHKHGKAIQDEQTFQTRWILASSALNLGSVFFLYGRLSNLFSYATGSTVLSRLGYTKSAETLTTLAQNTEAPINGAAQWLTQASCKTVKGTGSVVPRWGASTGTWLLSGASISLMQYLPQISQLILPQALAGSFLLQNILLPSLLMAPLSIINKWNSFLHAL